jgi:hypothetical protein
MRCSTLLALLATLVSACSSDKSGDNPQPQPSGHDSLDSAANRVARDTMTDSTGHRDTTTSR